MPFPHLTIWRRKSLRIARPFCTSHLREALVQIQELLRERVA